MFASKTGSATAAIRRIATAAAAHQNNNKTASVKDLLTSPSRVAQALDWRKSTGSVLNMKISKNRIELAISSHPSYQEPIVSLSSITIPRNSKRAIDSSVADEVSQVISQYNVCGVVVDWPVQQEGWCGEACGRVLNVLEQLSNNYNAFQTTEGNRTPICLYDPNQATFTEDCWGRSTVYTRLPKTGKALHIASLEQYNAPISEESHAILNVWNNFSAKFWPDSIEQYHDNHAAFYQATVKNSKRNIFLEHPSTGLAAKSSAAITTTLFNNNNKNNSSTSTRKLMQATNDSSFF